MACPGGNLGSVCGLDISFLPSSYVCQHELVLYTISPFPWVSEPPLVYGVLSGLSSIGQLWHASGMESSHGSEV